LSPRWDDRPGSSSSHFGINRRTVSKILKHSIPPGYRQSTDRPRPKLGSFTAIIDQILKDGADRPKKQRHTAKRVFERLHDEHGFAGGYTTIAAQSRSH
jgi:transposase